MTSDNDMASWNERADRFCKAWSSEVGRPDFDTLSKVYAADADVDIGPFKQLAEIPVTFDSGNDCLHFFQPPSIDISDGDRFDAGTTNGSPENLFAPTAATDQADPNTVVGAQDPAR